MQNRVDDEARKSIWDELAHVEDSCLWEVPKRKATGGITYTPPNEDWPYGCFNAPIPSTIWYQDNTWHSR